MIMRLSRPCYDKPWRCPGWAGGGMRYAKRVTCPNGVADKWGFSDRFAHWKFHRCDRCEILMMPYAVHWIDPQWWWFKASTWRYRYWK